MVTGHPQGWEQGCEGACGPQPALGQGSQPHSVCRSGVRRVSAPSGITAFGYVLPQGWEDWQCAESSSWHTSEEMLNTELMKTLPPMPSKKQTENQQVWATSSSDPTASDHAAHHRCSGLHGSIASELCTLIIFLIVVLWLIT